LDDLWVGVKGQSNLDIAGFPRNIFRYSVGVVKKVWGRALVVLGGALPLPTTKKLRIRTTDSGSQTLGAKVQGREGNSPDRTLRSLNDFSVRKEVKQLKQPGGGLGGSHPLKKA